MRLQKRLILHTDVFLVLIMLCILLTSCGNKSIDEAIESANSYVEELNNDETNGFTYTSLFIEEENIYGIKMVSNKYNFSEQKEAYEFNDEMQNTVIPLLTNKTKDNYKKIYNTLKPFNDLKVVFLIEYKDGFTKATVVDKKIKYYQELTMAVGKSDDDKEAFINACNNE